MSSSADLSQRSISAVLWGATGSAVQLSLQFGIQIVLARLLGPEQYGLFAIAFVVVSFSNFFSSIGIAYGLIQKRTVTDSDIRFTNFWQLALGSIVAATVFIFAEPISGFFQEPKVAPIIQALSVVCVLEAAAAPSLNLLKRDLDFKSIQLAHVVSYAIGYGLVGISLAVLGYGVVALASALITQTFLKLGLLYGRKRHVLGLVIWYGDAVKLIRYGLTVFATNVNNWMMVNLSRVIVGRVFPSGPMGLYSVSYNLVMQLANGLISVLESPLFSASARLQDDPERRRIGFLTVLAAVTLFVAPAFVGVAVAPGTIILALYGDAWRSGADLLGPFAIAMPMYIVLNMATPMLWTSGRTTQEFTLQLPITFVLAFAAYMAAQHSLVAVVWTVLGVFILRFVVVMTATCVALGLRVRDIARACRAGVAACLLVALGIGLVDEVATRAIDRRSIVLVVDIVTGMVVQLVALRLLRPWFSAELLKLFEKLLARLPRSVVAPLGELILAGRKRT